MTRPPLIEPTEQGLHCPRGGFHIDPWRPVPRAIVTHAHSDHAAWGCGSYLCAARGAGVLRERVGRDAPIDTLAWGERRTIGDVVVSLHPAGHILGSAQIRVEHGGEVWVVTGDYKTDPDPTCDPFEPIACDTLITESTFGLPIYKWRPDTETFAEINRWWRDCQHAGRTAVLFAYALGKAQRVLAGLDPSIGPILAHGAVMRFHEVYQREGVRLPTVLPANAEHAKAHKGRAIVIAPPGASDPRWLRKFQPVSLAMASGWMRIRGTRRRRALDRGFVLSDHADWPGLLRAIKDTGAARVGVTHGATRALTRYLSEQGLDAFVVPTRYEGELDEKKDEEPPQGAAGEQS